MKKLVTYLFVLGLLSVIYACRDESLNPVPQWEYAVHGFTVFDGIAFNGNINSRPQKYESDYAVNFPASGQDNAKINFKTRWVSLDNKLTVNKIELYINFTEDYTDPDGNPKTADLGSGVGKLLATISNVQGNRVWNSYSVTPKQIYDLYKDATVKYDKVNAVKVFSNPSHPRPTGKWFDGNTDNFILTWRLYTTDGKVFKTWNQASVCADLTSVSEANSNCQLVWSVN
ncbi:hypothetical protein [Arcicella rigui]|uniref:Lipoprotein n=1 Tax=Arcicella rigui TaxID=797020 RepID=A0ABU5QDC4_9BACT|nr:hypothetical protein [Arcicella rigui]MEA5140854.1 hypothetical protein [Arcicella rigui]